jgi:hypothetical protein
MEARILVWASPPGTRPTRTLAKSMSRRVVPPPPVHQFSGQHKKGHGHQRKRIDPGEHPLGNEQQRHITDQQDHQGGDSQAECHGKSQKHRPQKHQYQCPDYHEVS